MSFQTWDPEQICPIAILLITSGTRGNKLMFKYPTNKCQSLYSLFDKKNETSEQLQNKIEFGSTSSIDVFLYQPADEMGNRSTSTQENFLDSTNKIRTTAYVDDNKLSPELKEDLLLSLLAVKNNFSKERFFLKLEDVIFVGHSCGASNFTIGQIDDKLTISTFNVVFAMKSKAPKRIQDSLYNLAKSIASAICFEQKRVEFLNNERINIQNVTEDQEQEDNGVNSLDLLLEKSQLCRDLKRIVDSISQTGQVVAKINDMVTVCHYIPQRIYHVIGDVYVDSSAVIEAAYKIRPYHTLIFQCNKDEVLANIPDYNPDLKKFIDYVSVKDNIYITSLKCGLNLKFCLAMARTLVLCSKAIICYPIQETNMYWIAPHVNVNLNCTLLEHFQKKFRFLLLPKVFQQINTYRSYSDVICNLMIDSESGEQLFEWLLKHRLIYQLHKYFMFIQSSPAENIYSDYLKFNVFHQPKYKYSDDDPSNFLNNLYPLSFSDADVLMDTDVNKLIKRILPLCDGDHHLEEIAFQLCDSKCDEILRYIDLIGSHIITTESPDSVTSCFVGIV